MALLNNKKKKHRPFLSAKQVAEAIGAISPKSVSNRGGITKNLTRFPLGSHYGYDQDEVEALCQSIRDQGEREKKETERAMGSYERALRAVGE